MNHKMKGFIAAMGLFVGAGALSAAAHAQTAPKIAQLKADADAAGNTARVKARAARRPADLLAEVKPAQSQADLVADVIVGDLERTKTKRNRRAIDRTMANIELSAKRDPVGALIADDQLAERASYTREEVRALEARARQMVGADKPVVKKKPPALTL